MVSPGDQALTCTDCHNRNGRLNNLEGFYMVGRNTYAVIDWLGVLFIIFIALGVTVHGAMRVFAEKIVGSK
jgi:hypothetical protein